MIKKNLSKQLHIYLTSCIHVWNNTYWNLNQIENHQIIGKSHRFSFSTLVISSKTYQISRSQKPMKIMSNLCNILGDKDFIKFVKNFGRNDICYCIPDVWIFWKIHHIFVFWFWSLKERFCWLFVSKTLKYNILAHFSSNLSSLVANL